MKDDGQFFDKSMLFNKSMEYETVELDDEDGSIIIIDQTLLPGKMELIRLRTAGNMGCHLSSKSARRAGDRSDGGFRNLSSGKRNGCGSL